MLFASLFYEQFLQKQSDGASPRTSSLITFAMQVAVALPDSQLARIFKGELSEQEV
jgi:hypothetical protein